jgi:YegS/Rv2252/BmrU family lipid kinase
VRAAIIFNPAAKGDKARAFRGLLEDIARHCTLKRTLCAGDATRLATEAVAEGFDTIIAAGGDGTLNEVLNGLAATPGGLAQARLGVLPLGTVNVFARELGFSTQPRTAWAALLNARERTMDLPFVEWYTEGRLMRRYFAQMAGAGLDARSIELTSWSLKKKIGPLAYVAAGLKAMLEAPPEISVEANGRHTCGQLVLIGNGRKYGGEFRVFPEADVGDGLLDICVFPKTNWRTLARCGVSLLARKRLPEHRVIRMRAAEMKLSATTPVRFEVEGELGGHLPARIALLPHALRVMHPPVE